MQLAGLDIARFLAEHWQKRPLLIRNPWNHWRNPLEPDELAGLACEEGVESRLILREADRLKMESGPLPEARFSEIGTGPWTLLVQAVNHHASAVAALVEPFRFIPDWRIDDVMVSYATNGGGVGPHFDQYDVFLVQGLGRRRWRVGPRCDASTPLVPHEDLGLIADFEATGDWILEPGDILYVPPLFAHDGVAASDDCMTYSVGFRAPSRADLMDGWSAHRADVLTDEDRYSDPDLETQAHPGEIAASALDRLHAMTMEALSDREAFARWFGAYNSLPKYADVDWRREEPVDREAVRSLLSEGAALYRNPASRFSFIRQAADILLFVDGQCFDCTDETVALAERLCAGPVIDLESPSAPTPAVLTLIAALIDQGSLSFDADSDNED